MKRLIVHILALLGIITSPSARAGGDTILYQPNSDQSAFFRAVQTGDLETVRAMIGKNRALVNITDEFGFQPIHVLDYANFSQMLALLLDHGADINAVNFEGIALLHILIDEEFIPDVIAAGANIELRDNLGRTPLLVHILEPDSYGMIEALIDAGADVNAKNKAGNSALALAQEDDNHDLIKFLMRFGANE